VSAGDLFIRYPSEGTVRMIVIGADTHKQSHTVGAVDAATGRALADRTVKAKKGFHKEGYDPWFSNLSAVSSTIGGHGGAVQVRDR
jgi:hypothetical protein